MKKLFVLFVCVLWASSAFAAPPSAPSPWTVTGGDTVQTKTHKIIKFGDVELKDDGAGNLQFQELGGGWVDVGTSEGEANPTTVSEAEAQAGTETDLRSWSPALVRAAIEAMPRWKGLIAASPTADEDTADGYIVGDIVGVTGTTEYWLCLDNSAGAAVWVRGLVVEDIGATVQAYDADLTTYAGITPSANIQSLLGAANYAAARTLLDLEAGTDFYSVSAADLAFQPLDADLTAIVALAKTDGNIIVGDGSTWVAESGATARTSLGLAIGTNVQAQSTYLQAIHDASGVIAGTNVNVNGIASAITSRDSADLILLYDNSAGANVKMTVGNFVSGLGGTGSSVSLDLADDGSDESDGITEIAVTNDTNSIFTEPTDNKLLIDVSADWPTADVAETGDSATAFFSAGTIEHEYGGLEADVSEYSGLVKIASGSTSAVTVTSAGEAILDDADAAAQRTTLGLVIGTDVLAQQTIGIANDNLVEMDDADAADNDFAKFTANGLEGRSYSEVLSDIGAEPADAAIVKSDEAETITSNWSFSGNPSFTGSPTIGNGDTDTLTIQALIQGGNSRALWVADSAPTPTYADGPNDVYIKEDVEVGGTVYAASVNTGTGTDGSRGITFTSNSIAPAASGNKLYFLDNVLKVVEGGTAKDVPLPDDSVTWTGATHSFAGVTNMVLPTATPDANGEVGINNTNDTFLMYINSGLITLDFTGDTADYVLKSNGSGLFTLQEDATAGTPTLNSIGDPTADSEIEFDAGEEITWLYSGAFTTGSQFLISQAGGNVSAGAVLFESRAADTDTITGRFGDGTNYVQISKTGNVSHGGSSSFTAPRITTSIAPTTSDGASLGTAALEFSDIYLANGAQIIGQVDGSATLTSSASTWTASNFASAGTLAAAGDFTIATADPDIILDDTDGADGFIQVAANDADDAVVTIGVDDSGGDDQGYVELDGVNETVDILQNMTAAGIITSVGAILPSVTDTPALGSATYAWSDLFIGDGGKIDFNSNMTITHSLDTLTIAGGGLVAPTVTAASFISSADDGDHVLNVTNGTTLNAALATTDGLLAENGGRFFVSDGTGEDWDKYLLDSEYGWTASGAVTFNANPKIYDGDSHHATFDIADLSGDVTYTFPAATSTIAAVGGDIGAATATTPAENDNDTSVATTAYVQTEIASLHKTKSFVLNEATVDDDFLIWKPPQAITILSVNGVLQSGTNVVGHVVECDSDGANCAGIDGATDITFNGGNDADDGTLSNPTIDADDWVGWRTTSVSSPGYLTVTIEYTID